jgi:hypothetical protein
MNFGIRPKAIASTSTATLKAVGKKVHIASGVPFFTREQFDEFVNHCGLHAEDVQTMGSIGSPGFDYGWSPAISFNSDSQDAIQSAYVTPIPEVERKRGKENDWDRVRDAVLAVMAEFDFGAIASWLYQDILHQSKP